MAQIPRDDWPPRSLDRRRFLALGTGAVAAAGAAAVGWPAPATAGHRSTEPYGFALLGDTQIDAAVPDRTDWVSWVYQQIDATGAPIACHVGDIMEYGSQEEYDLYLGTIPDRLWPRMRHVPGNHEWRWDPTAGERYRTRIGPTRYSFDAGGMHFVGLDPSHLLQEPGGFGQAGIDWLEKDLRRVRPGRPVVLMCHFPFGGDNRYVSDQERLLALLHRYDVRTVFAGHIHTEQVHRFNGVTQLAVDDTRAGPVYYWVERVSERRHSVLQVSVVRRAADGGPTDPEPVVEMPLSGPRPAEWERPRSVRLDPAAGALAVSVRLAGRADPARVDAQLYPQHTYGLKEAGQWQELAADRSGRGFDGSLDVGALPPGQHRMTVRVTDPAGAWYEQTHEFRLPGADRVRWRRELGMPIQAGLAEAGGWLVAATTGGTVIGERPGRGRPRRRWREQLGPVHGRPAFSADGQTVFVPSTDHRLYALDRATGRQRFAYDAGEPVLGSPLLTEVDGRPVVVVGAGQTRHAVDAATGARLWTATGQGIFAGRPAADGTRVYTGGGDGHAYAYEAGTGEVLWSFATNDRDSAYRRLIYGPWFANLELLPGGLVLVATVTTAHALDAATGQEQWSRSGSYIYAPATHLTGGDLLLIDDWQRTATRVDAATGQERWTVDIGVRVLHTGAVVHGDTAWVMGTTGLLVAVDLDSGSVTERLQLTTTAYCYSTPVIVDGTLLVGDQDGVLHALSLT